MTEKTSLLPICLKCGAQCCKRKGSPMVLPNERDIIINKTGKDVFKKEGNYYIIPENPCPFLENNKCSIHNIRPLDCKIYPYNIIKKNNEFKIAISQICPAKHTLNNEFTSDAQKELDKLSKEQKEDLNKLNIKDEWNFKEQNKNYGQELIMDLHGCDVKTFSQENLKKYFIEICNKIEMKRHGEPMFWEYHSEIPHLKGVSAIQFIETSNIVIHALNILGEVYINLFSCKKFNQETAAKFSKDFFKAEKIVVRTIDRI